MAQRVVVARLTKSPGSEGEAYSIGARRSSVSLGGQSFDFSRVCGDGMGQEAFFRRIMRSATIGLFGGKHCAVFCIGGSGSGKSFTTSGGEEFEQQGIMQRVLSLLYEYLAANSENPRHEYDYQLLLSFLGVRRGEGFDLLDENIATEPIEEWQQVSMKANDDGSMSLMLPYTKTESEDNALSMLSLGLLNKLVLEMDDPPSDLDLSSSEEEEREDDDEDQDDNDADARHLRRQGRKAERERADEREERVPVHTVLTLVLQASVKGDKDNIAFMSKLSIVDLAGFRTTPDSPEELIRQTVFDRVHPVANANRTFLCNALCGSLHADVRALVIAHLSLDKDKFKKDSLRVANMFHTGDDFAANRASTSRRKAAAKANSTTPTSSKKKQKKSKKKKKKKKQSKKQHNSEDDHKHGSETTTARTSEHETTTATPTGDDDEHNNHNDSNEAERKSRDAEARAKFEAELEELRRERDALESKNARLQAQLTASQEAVRARHGAQAMQKVSNMLDDFRQQLQDRKVIVLPSPSASASSSSSLHNQARTATPASSPTKIIGRKERGRLVALIDLFLQDKSPNAVLPIDMKNDAVVYECFNILKDRVNEHERHTDKLLTRHESISSEIDLLKSKLDDQEQLAALHEARRNEAEARATELERVQREQLEKERAMGEEAKDFRATLERGIEILKHGRHGAPHMRKVILRDGNKLFWYADKQNKFVRLSAITAVKEGLVTDVLKKLDASRGSRCFSLITATRTLNFEAKTPAAQKFWVRGMRALLATTPK